MALLNNKGAEFSQEFYKALRARNSAARAALADFREVLEVRTHKRAFGFSLIERARYAR